AREPASEAAPGAAQRPGSGAGPVCAGRFLRTGWRAERSGRVGRTAAGADACRARAAGGESPAANPHRPAPGPIRRAGGARRAGGRAPEAERVLFALGGFSEPAGELSALVESVAPQQVLTLAELALPAVKAQPQPQRDRFLAEYAARVERDGRVTLHEFVLLT